MILIVSNGENDLQSPFEENIRQVRLFQLIDQFTSALPEVKLEHILKNLCRRCWLIKICQKHSQMSKKFRGNLQEELDVLQS